ncbi:S41 family peptidase [Schaalia sp. 19OD2882]|nr:S41 family peptidase [Schaalia sp. 19OD2882]
MAVLLVLALVVGGVLAGGAWLVSSYGHTIGIWWPAPSVQGYGDKVLSLMDQGLHAKSQEWSDARADATARIAKATSHEEVDAILTDVVKVAGGKHSFMISAETAQSVFDEYEAPTTTRDGCVVTLTLPAYMGTADKGAEYATTLADALTGDTCGVIVDLRSNGGGDMGPMIAGLSPLLPDGRVASFKSTDGMTTDVTLNGGAIQGGGSPTDVGRRSKLKVPVAVLVSERTASSGEQALLAFRGLDGVKVFGRPTAGYTSVNQVFPLYTGSLLAMTVGTTVARTGEEFAEEPIAPDQVVDLEAAPQAAADWIASQRQ